MEYSEPPPTKFFAPKPMDLMIRNTLLPQYSKDMNFELNALFANYLSSILPKHVFNTFSQDGDLTGLLVYMPMMGAVGAVNDTIFSIFNVGFLNPFTMPHDSIAQFGNAYQTFANYYVDAIGYMNIFKHSKNPKLNNPRFHQIWEKTYTEERMNLYKELAKQNTSILDVAFLLQYTYNRDIDYKQNKGLDYLTAIDTQRIPSLLQSFEFYAYWADLLWIDALIMETHHYCGNQARDVAILLSQGYFDRYGLALLQLHSTQKGICTRTDLNLLIGTHNAAAEVFQYVALVLQDNRTEYSNPIFIEGVSALSQEYIDSANRTKIFRNTYF